MAPNLTVEAEMIVGRGAAGGGAGRMNGERGPPIPAVVIIVPCCRPRREGGEVVF